jgi:diguanylate cyclase (GGDEF)-like protein
MTSAYAGYFFAGRAFWGQLAAAVGSYALGAVLAPPETAVTSILTITGVALALGIVLHRLTNLLRERTLFDPLTRAVSRATWLKIADGELHRSGGQRVTVAMIDLDEFKETNDLLGHLAGDQLLRDVATAWTRSLGRDGLLGRYGGDEFVVLFLDSDDRTVRAVLDRLERAHPVRWTVGFATAEAGDDLTGLLHRVDLELRVGKGIRPLRRPRTIPRQPLARRRTTQMVATEPESTR